MTDHTITDCGDEGCEECDVCRYLNFLEWSGQVAPSDIPSTVARNEIIEAHLDAKYPHWRKSEGVIHG